MTWVKFTKITGFLTVNKRSYKKLTAEIQAETSGISVVGK